MKIFYTEDENGCDILQNESGIEQVMMEWEKPYMEESIKKINPFGKVLEIGFGMGYSATQICSFENVKEYNVIECSPTVWKKIEEWKKKQRSDLKINLIKGRWEDVLFECEKYDCVYFDDHPEEGTSVQILMTRLRKFYIEILKNHSFIGTKLCNFCRINSNDLDGISCVKFEMSEYDIKIPDNCNYAKGDTMYIPIYTKISEFVDGEELPKQISIVPLTPTRPFIVVDNFYSNCLEVNEFIMKEKFVNNVSEKSYINDRIKEKFEKHLGKNITSWSSHNNGHYHVLTSLEKSSVCVDNFHDWIGILFMSKFVPHECGVCIHTFKDGTFDKINMKNKKNKQILSNYKYDFNKWNTQDKIGNSFNRLVLIKSELFYSINHFGTSLVDGNLVQIFKFTTTV
jgi:hypothetical protein